jgi:hypothetical protein
LDKCDERKRVMILLLASTGTRISALPLLKVKHLVRVLDSSSSSSSIMYQISVYAGTPGQYIRDGRTTVSRLFENGTVPIKEVEIGMVLWAYDDVNNSSAKTTITSKKLREVPHYYRVNINGWAFKMSEDHTVRDLRQVNGNRRGTFKLEMCVYYLT